MSLAVSNAEALSSDGSVQDEDDQRRLQDDELDFDEEQRSEPKQSDDGEVSDELEEGELKDDDEEEDGQTVDEPVVNRQDRPSSRTPQQQQHSVDGQPKKAPSVCRFFPKGQCTWGAACRFLHVARAPGAVNRQRAEGESSWERGLQRAKEALLRAKDRRSDVVEEFDEEYERKRRLAFEHCPEAPEQFNDPWDRKRKTPAAKSLSRSESDSPSSASVDSWSDSSLSESDSTTTNSNEKEPEAKKRRRSESSEDDRPNTSRREELLAQLRQVEEQIAKKRAVKESRDTVY